MINGGSFKETHQGGEKMAVARKEISTKLGRLPQVATILSILACYGTLLTVSVLSLLGVTLVVHKGAWAGLITFFAWLALAGVAINFRRYRVVGPLIVAAVGSVFITWVMFVSFNRIMELIGFAGLITATVWDIRIKRLRQGYLDNT